MEKLKTILWFAKRPSFYNAALHIILRRLLNKNDRKQHQKALEWCNKNKTTMEDVLISLNGKVEPLFSAVHKDLITKGEKILKNLPVTMGGAGGINIIYTLIKIYQPKKIVETGVAAGWSSLAILKGIEEIPDARLISVDMPYPKMNNENYVGCVVPEILRHKWTLIRQPDRYGLVKAIRLLKEVDFCHYDSDKSYSGRTWAYRIIWKSLNPGGILVSDDIQDNIAFKEFCERVGKKPFVLEDSQRFIGIIIK